MAASSTTPVHLLVMPMLVQIWAGASTGTAMLKPTAGVNSAQPNSLASKIASTGVGWIDRQLRALETLSDNWDGYGAEKVDPVRLNQIGAILEHHLPVRATAGSVVPGADGSLQAEWHTRSGSFGLVVDDFGRVSAWHRPISGDEVEAIGLEAANLLRYVALAAMV